MIAALSLRTVSSWVVTTARVSTTSTLTLTVTFAAKLLAEFVEVFGFGFGLGGNFVGFGLRDDFLLDESSESGFKVTSHTAVLFG